MEGNISSNHHFISLGWRELWKEREREKGDEKEKEEGILLGNWEDTTNGDDSESERRGFKGNWCEGVKGQRGLKHKYYMAHCQKGPFLFEIHFILKLDCFCNSVWTSIYFCDWTEICIMIYVAWDERFERVLNLLKLCPRKQQSTVVLW